MKSAPNISTMTEQTTSALLALEIANINTLLEKREQPLKILLDAGHGGFDCGAVVNGISERDENLMMALALKWTLQQIDKITIGMTRTQNSEYPSWPRRTRAFAADLALAIHHNSAGAPPMAYFPLATGAYVKNTINVKRSRAFAQFLHDTSDNRRFYIAPDTQSRFGRLYIRDFRAPVAVLWEIDETRKHSREDRLKSALHFLKSLSLALKTGTL